MRALTEVMAEAHTVAEVFTDKHFIYTGGDHGDGYVNYRPLGAVGSEFLLREVCVHLVRNMLIGVPVEKYRNIVIIGPETMGAKMVKQIGCTLEDELPYIIHTRTFVKDPNKAKSFLWNADPEKLLDEDSLVLWIDDLLNGGTTFEATAPMIHYYDAQVYGIGVIGDRSGLTPEKLSVRRITSLEQFSLKRYPEAECPSCRDHIPIVDNLGHGAKFKATHPSYQGGFIPAR